MPFSFNSITRVFNDWVKNLLPSVEHGNDTQAGNENPQPNNPETANRDAEFFAWQKTPTGEVFALYTVTAEHHPFYHSTVSERTLRQQNLRTPPTPIPQDKLKRLDDEQ